MALKTYYRDLDLNFKKHPVTNDIVTLSDTESVKRAIKNLLSHKKYEKHFHPEINSEIYDMLFENMNPLRFISVRQKIEQVLLTYEPRIKLNSVQVKPNLDGNSVTINLNFTVISIQAPVNFSVNLSRSR